MLPAQPLLTIAVPTYNRRGYLRELLASLAASVNSLGAEDRALVFISVRDNASPVDPEADVNQILAGLNHQYSRNAGNIGADRNFLECIKSCVTEYLWLVGDDELVPIIAVRQILDVLREFRPSLCILSDGSFQFTAEHQAQYASYGTFIDAVEKFKPSGVVAHSLISCNVFRTQKFNLHEAERKLNSNYAHMYGLIPHLSGSVYLFPPKLPGQIHVREERAPFADKITNLKFKQNFYMAAIGRRWSKPTLIKVALGEILRLAFHEVRDPVMHFLHRGFSLLKRLLKGSR